MRHAKSDWSRKTTDFDRPLNPRGVHSAKLMGRWLAANNTLPDHIITSPARRATETAALVCNGAGLETGMITDDAMLYEADLDTLIVVAEAQLAAYQAPMLIGHNPSISLLLDYLTGAAHAAMTTANIAVVALPEKSRAPFLPANAGKLITLAQPQAIEGRQ